MFLIVIATSLYIFAFFIKLFLLPLLLICIVCFSLMLIELFNLFLCYIIQFIFLFFDCRDFSCFLFFNFIFDFCFLHCLLWYFNNIVWLLRCLYLFSPYYLLRHHIFPAANSLCLLYVLLLDLFGASLLLLLIFLDLLNLLFKLLYQVILLLQLVVMFAALVTMRLFGLLMLFVGLFGISGIWTFLIIGDFFHCF